jgi:hypothetical protein
MKVGRLLSSLRYSHSLKGNTAQFFSDYGLWGIEPLRVVRSKSLGAPCLAVMPYRRKLVRKPGSETDDLRFPPPFSEQAKYLELADLFLSPADPPEQSPGNNIESIETATGFKKSKHKAA